MQISLSFSSIDELLEFCKDFKSEDLSKFKELRLEVNPPTKEENKVIPPKEESKELTTALKKEFKLDDKAQSCKSIIHKMIQDKGTEKVKEFFLAKFNKSTVPDVLNMYKDKYDELEAILLKGV